MGAHLLLPRSQVTLVRLAIIIQDNIEYVPVSTSRRHKVVSEVLSIDYLKIRSLLEDLVVIATSTSKG
jgi:hypothetical protein